MKCVLLLGALLLGFQIESRAQISAAPSVPAKPGAPAETRPVKNPPARSERTKSGPAAKATVNRTFVLGAEVRQYQYLEPGLVEHVGLLSGIWGEWYWMSFLGNGKLYGNLLYGSLTYKGAMCDELNNCYPYEGPTTDIITKVNSRLEYDLNPYFMLFGGAGFRYLYDMGEGAGFYRRTGQWLYLPLGAAFTMPTSSGAFVLDMEYDAIVFGQIKSDLSQVSSSFEDLTLNQRGYGLVISAGYRYNPEWDVRLLYERWDLERSDDATTNGQTFHEPANHSDSYGLRVGYSF